VWRCARASGCRLVRPGMTKLARTRLAQIPAAPLYKAPEPPGQKPRAAFMLLKLQRIRSKASLRNRPPFLGGRLRSGNGPGLNERPEACHDAVERPFSKGRAPPPLVELQEHRWRAKGGDTARGRA
jgi:hypothetical protein